MPDSVRLSPEGPLKVLLPPVTVPLVFSTLVRLRAQLWHSTLVTVMA